MALELNPLGMLTNSEAARFSQRGLALAIRKAVDARIRRESGPGHSTALVVLTGEGSTGKTTIAGLIRDQNRSSEDTSVIEVDDFAIPRAQRLAQGLSGYNLNAFDLSSFKFAVDAVVSERRTTWIPKYDHKDGSSCQEVNCTRHSHWISPAPLVILVGVPTCLECMASFRVPVSVYFGLDPQHRRNIRIQRDVLRRGMNLSVAARQFELLEDDRRVYIEPSIVYCSFSACVQPDYSYMLQLQRSSKKL